MTLRNLLANVATGAVEPGSAVDANFTDVYQLAGITQCAATGTNAVTLTPAANQAVVTTPLPANRQMFEWVAAATSTGSVTVQVGSGSFVPLYLADGTTQVGSGQHVINTPYVGMFLTALNAGAGGMIILNAGATGVTPGTYGALTIDASGRVTATTLPGSLVGVQIFLASATYTPTARTNAVVVEVLGAGGGGGGAALSGAATVALGFGGGTGGYARKRLTSGFSGASVTIGAAGTAGVAGNNAGGNGGVSSFGAVTGNGGSGGAGSAAFNTPFVQPIASGSAGGTALGGDLNITGQSGGTGIALAATASGFISGAGAPSPYGAGAPGTVNTGSGGAATGFGSGGSGGASGGSGASQTGGAGAPGLVIVWEYS